MASEIVTSGRVEKGRLKIRNQDHFNTALASMKDGEVIVRVVRQRAARSLAQNAFYWSVVVEMVSEHTGYSPDEIHELFKAKFIPKKLAVQDGNGEIVGEFVIGGTTTTMNTKAFGEYIEAIRQWAADELDVVIPEPGQVAA